MDGGIKHEAGAGLHIPKGCNGQGKKDQTAGKTGLSLVSDGIKSVNRMLHQIKNMLEAFNQGALQTKAEAPALLGTQPAGHSGPNKIKDAEPDRYVHQQPEPFLKP